MFYKVKAWINRGSGWIIESTESQYINISTHRPLVGSSYTDLPIELKHLKKGLMNIKNNDQECFFLWCHVRHINPLKEHPEKKNKKMIKILLVVLIMMILNFL